jgi:hypothetical protein
MTCASVRSFTSSSWVYLCPHRSLLRLLTLLSLLTLFSVKDAAASHSPFISVQQRSMKIAILFNFPMYTAEQIPDYDDQSHCNLREQVYDALMSKSLGRSHILDIKYITDHCCSEGNRSCNANTIQDLGELRDRRLIRLLNFLSPSQLRVDAYYGGYVELLGKFDFIVVVSHSKHLHPSEEFSERFEFLQRAFQLLPIYRRPVLIQFMASRDELAAEISGKIPFCDGFAGSIIDCLRSDDDADDEIRSNCLTRLGARYTDSVSSLVRLLNSSYSTAGSDVKTAGENGNIYTSMQVLQISRQYSVVNTGSVKFSQDESVNTTGVEAMTLSNGEISILSSMKRYIQQEKLKRTDTIRQEKILCLTYTTSVNHDRIVSIINTWGKYCDGYLAFSNVTDVAANTLQLESTRASRPERYSEMWFKTQLIWTFLYRTPEIFDYFDYFFLGGDDLYCVVDNLRQLLNDAEILEYLSSFPFGPPGMDEAENCHGGIAPLYLGRLAYDHAIRYNSGGAGYVLNRAALKALSLLLNGSDVSSVSEGSIDKFGDVNCLNHFSTSMEDVMVSYCLAQAGIEPFPYSSLSSRSTDISLQMKLAEDRNESFINAYNNVDRYSADEINVKLARLFHPVSPIEAIEPQRIIWYAPLVDKYVAGTACCANSSISFQNIKPPAYSMEGIHRELFGNG